MSHFYDLKIEKVFFFHAATTVGPFGTMIGKMLKRGKCMNWSGMAQSLTYPVRIENTWIEKRSQLEYRIGITWKLVEGRITWKETWRAIALDFEVEIFRVFLTVVDSLQNCKKYFWELFLCSVLFEFIFSFVRNGALDFTAQPYNGQG